MTDILVAGETLVDLIPETNASLDQLSGFTHRPGGAPANVAAGLAKLNANVALWTQLGDDRFGTYLYETLEDHGLPDGPITVQENGQTTLAVVTHDDSGDASFDFYGGRDTTFGFSPGEIPTALVADCSWIHLGGVLLTHPRGDEAMRALIQEAQAQDCIISFDPNTRPSLWQDDDADRISDSMTVILDGVDVLTGSPADFQGTRFTAEDTDELLAELLHSGPHTVFLSRGDEPTLVRSSDDAPWGASDVTVDTYPATVEDTTGAGDGFTAGVIHKLTSESLTTGPEDAARFGNAVGAITVQSRGGISALPTEATVDCFVENGLE